MNTVTEGNLLDLERSCSPFQHRHDPASIDDSAQVRMIERSRRRCITLGLKETFVPADEGCSDLRASQASSTPDGQNRLLQAHALPVMEMLALQLGTMPGAVVLADAHGVVLHVKGEEEFLARARMVALRCGACWSEENKGTNAIGTALTERMPVTVRAEEHYLASNRFLAGAAAPVVAYNGSMLGVLGISCDKRHFRHHLQELVRLSAQMIENQLFSSLCRDAITLHFSTCPDLVGTLSEAIVSFTPDGRFLSANRMGELHLGMPLADLRGQSFSALLGLPLAVLFDHHRAASSDLLEMRLQTGEMLYGRPQLRLAAGTLPHAPPASSSGGGRMSGLRYLNTGDPQVAAVIEKLSRVVGRKIPILVTGETGTGKELLACAIHEDSPRAKGPFVAVNCASIPESLIESELFGYEDGAFTGARRKGSVGKIVQANGGTLFLDEIGDMPFNLQARLLRVLQERAVTPLGSTKAVAVDVELVCATNRNLREMIARGEFREDLYYRLNGLVVKVPSVRERTDLDVVIDKILRAESREVRRSVAPEVMQLFKRHRWPGNFRQMRSVLRTAVIMASDADEIRLEHLPDDFLDEAEAVRGREAGPQDVQTTRAVPCAGDLDAVEREAIRRTLEAHDGNVSATARVLGISRNTIYRKLNGAGELPAAKMIRPADRG